MNQNKTKLPVWFWVISIIMLLWNLMGVASFFAHAMISEESLQALSEGERNLYGNYPLWTKVVFAIATFSGALGCIALLMRKKWATPVFLVSFITICIQMGHSLFIAGAYDFYGPKHAILPAVVALVGLGLYFFSKHAEKQGWIN